MMEMTGQSYESLMGMPHQKFENFFKWKTDMEREKETRQKKEIESQNYTMRKQKAEQNMNMSRHRLKNYMKRS